MKTLHDLIDEAHALGFRINNLFEQHTRHAWQANVREADDSGGRGFEFGLGATPEEALAIAIEKARANKKQPSHTPPAPATTQGLFD